MNANEFEAAFLAVTCRSNWALRTTEIPAFQAEVKKGLKILESAKEALKSVALEAYAVGSGTSKPENRLRATYGNRKTTVYAKNRNPIPGQTQIFITEDVITHVVADIRQRLALEESHDVGMVVHVYLVSQFDFTDKIAAALKNVAGIEKALETVQANRRRAKESAHRAALVRLSEFMTGNDYTEDEVMSAWNLGQVKKVMES